MRFCLFRICVIVRTYDMRIEETPEDVKSWFRSAIAGMWPVAEGSLSLRRTPCIRRNCSACARGEGHQSHVLYGRSQGRRFSIYVPDNLAPQVRRAIDNGRRLQELMNDAGVRYVQALKKERRQKQG